MAIPDWKRIHQEATIVDLHIHPSMQQSLFGRRLGMRYAINRKIHGSPLAVRASFPRMRDGGYDVFMSTIHIPEKGLVKDFPLVRIFSVLRPVLWRQIIAAQPYDATLRVMADMEKAAAESSGYGWAKIAHSVAELNDILSLPRDNRPIAAVHAIEGAHSLGGKQASEAGVLGNLETLFKRGVAMITLAHFYPNQVVNPGYPFPEDIARLSAHATMWRDLTRGLTDTGVKVVERMMEMGMLIDISHCTPTARKQIYDLADAAGKDVPLVASHVGAYEINPTPYNLSDWEIQRIARGGGVIGVIFMPYWLMPKESRQGINYISRHIQYLMKVGGEDVVGLGTDFDGFTTPPDDLDTASHLPRLTQRLVVDGYREDQIKKILGGNALRVMCQGWGKQQ